MYRLSIVILIATIVLVNVNFALAQPSFEEFSGLSETAATNSTYDTSKTDLIKTIAMVLRYVLSLLGIVMFCVMLIGYFIMSSAGGNEEDVTKAKNWIKRGFIGVLIVMVAYFLTAVFIHFFAGTGESQVFEAGILQ